MAILVMTSRRLDGRATSRTAADGTAANHQSPITNRQSPIRLAPRPAAPSCHSAVRQHAAKWIRLRRQQRGFDQSLHSQLFPRGRHLQHANSGAPRRARCHELLSPHQHFRLSDLLQAVRRASLRVSPGESVAPRPHCVRAVRAYPSGSSRINGWPLQPRRSLRCTRFTPNRSLGFLE